MKTNESSNQKAATPPSAPKAVTRISRILESLPDDDRARVLKSIEALYYVPDTQS